MRPGDPVLYRAATRARQRLGWVREVREHNGQPIAARILKRTRTHWLAITELALTRPDLGPCHGLAHDHGFDI